MPAHEDGYFEGRTTERLDTFGEKLDRIEQKLDNMGDRVTKLEMAKVFLSGGKAMLVLIGGIIFEVGRLVLERIWHK